MDVLRVETAQRSKLAVSLTKSADEVREAQRLQHRMFSEECGAHYPGKTFQPYASVRVGMFNFIDSGTLGDKQMVQGLNAANELTGASSISHLIGGVASHFCSPKLPPPCVSQQAVNSPSGLRFPDRDTGLKIRYDLLTLPVPIMKDPAMTRSDRRPPVRPRPVSSKLEHEIKLSVDPDFRLPRLPGTPLPRKILTSTYYDTASYDLAHACVTLRYRVEQGKKAWQLKLPLGDDRQEVEIVDQHQLPPSAFRDLLVLHLGERKLAPVATLRVWRTGLLVRHNRIPAAKIALDSVSVVKNDCVIQRFRELEIEQAGPDEELLRNLERQLRRAGAHDHDGRPKLFRALSLPAPAPEAPPAQKAPPADHVKWALTQHVRWLLAHDPGTRLGTQIESLHQMRVAARRLRAVFRAAQPMFVPEWAASLEKELAWLSEFLGQARDLDVQIAYFNGESARLDSRDRKPLAQFVAHLQTQRERLQQVVLSELKSTRYFELIRRLRQAAQDPSIVDTAVTFHELAEREFKKLRKAIRRLGPAPNHAVLHAIRIKTKRARYAAELALWSVGKPATRFMKQARAVQDLLGNYQDSFTAEIYIRAFLKQSTGVRAGFVAGRMVERQRQRRDTLQKNVNGLLETLLKRGKKAWG